MPKSQIDEEIKKLNETRHKMGEAMIQMREGAFKRFPFLFIFLSTFGVVATFLGMEMIIDEIPFLTDRPFTVLFAGIITLALTGALYKKLS